MTKTINNDEKTLRAIRRGDFNDCYLIYNRKSTDEAESQKNSIVYQRKENCRLAEKEGFRLADISLTGFCREGVISEKHSAFKEGAELVITKKGTVQYQIERPKFQQLVQLLNNGHFKGVICLCWDRISRNRGDDTVLRKLKKNGIEIQFALASYDKTSSGELHMDIDGMFAQHHSRVTSEKVRLATKASREAGKCTYRAPIGYLNEGNIDFKPFDPERAPIIKDLFELYSTGNWSLSDLARHAQKQGLTSVPSRRRRTREEILADDEDEEVERPMVTRTLPVNAIGAILRNPFYMGQVVGPDQAYVPSTSHEAIVDADTFYRVQALLKSKRTSIHYTNKLQHPFRGFVRCAQCRRVYTPYEKKGILYYNARCAKDCNNTLKNINFDFLSDCIRELLGKLQFTSDEIDLLEARTDTEISLIQDKNNKSEERRSREQSRLRMDLKFLRENRVQLLRSGLYNPASLLEEVTKLESALDKLQSETDEDELALRQTFRDVVKISELLDMAQNLYDLAKPTEKEAIAKTMVSELLLDQNTFDYKAQTGFRPFFERNFSSGTPKLWISELEAGQISDVITQLKASLGNS